MQNIFAALLLLLACTNYCRATVTLAVGTPSDTEAVLTINLTAPTGSACTVEVATDSAYANIIPDANATLFTNANKSNRGFGSWIVSNQRQVYKIGTRGRAYLGSDGKYYSRVPQAASLLYVRVNNDGACDSGSAATTTVTMGTIPYGQMYQDTIPTDPANPGITAWPEMRGIAHTGVTDPQTGQLYVPITVPGDLSYNVASNTATPFGTPYDSTSTWALTSGALPATFSGTNSAKLALPFDPAQSGAPALNSANNYTYEFKTSTFLNYLNTHLTAYCSSGSCSSATSANKTMDGCLSVNGVTCASATIKIVLPTSSTAGTPNFGGANYGMTDWEPFSTPINHVNSAAQTTQVTVSGTAVTYADNINSEFRTSWTVGTRVSFTGTGCGSGLYSIATLTSVQSLATATSSGCTGSAAMKVIQLQLLVWKDSASTDTITLSAANYDWSQDAGANADSAAMQDSNNSTGGPPITVGGCIGYLAYHGGAWYWESSQCGQVNFLGQWIIPYGSSGLSAPNQALPLPGDGICAFDGSTAGLVYCSLLLYGADVALLKVQFSGPYTNNGTAGATISPTFGSSCTPSPCLSVTILESSLMSKALTNFPTFAASCCATSPNFYSRNSDGTLQIQFPNATNQNESGWESVYNPATTSFIAMRLTVNDASFIHSDSNGCHGTLVCYGSELGDMLDSFIGPLSGPGTYPLDGPFRVRVPAGISTAGSSCGSPPATIPAKFYAGGSQSVVSSPGVCTTVTLASNVLADPSPYVTSISVSVTNGSPSVTTGSTFPQIYAGKPVLISGTVYTFKTWPNGGWTNSGVMTLTANFTGTSGTYTATVYADPTCAQDSVPCDVSTDHDLRTVQVGDILFVGQPTTGVTGYSTCTETENTSLSECFLVTAVSTTSPSSSSPTITLMHGYSKNSTVQAWGTNTYLYLGSTLDNYVVDSVNDGYNTGWNYTSYPNGQYPLSSVLDQDPPVGHNYATANGTAGYYASSSVSTPSGNAVGCAGTATLWNGLGMENCYGIRFTPPTNFSFVTAAPIIRPYSAPFSGLLGIGDNYSDQVDDHPTLPYLSAKSFMLGGRNLNGGTVTSGNTPCTNLTGTLYRCTYAQQGYASAAAAVTGWKTLPTHNFCGLSVLSEISGPSATIGGSSANYYQFVKVLHTNEAYSGSNAGDVLVNCPYTNNLYSWAGPADGTNGQSGTLGDGGDQVDINVIPSSCCAHALTQVDFSVTANNSNGRYVRTLGHGLWRYHWYTVFSALRATPDGLGGEDLAIGTDGFKSQILLTPLPPTVFDSIDRTTFIKIPVQIPATASYGYATVEFGYAENGDPASGLFCTPRQEACRTNSGSGDPFLYASETQVPATCTSGCTIQVPALSQRKLYYRVMRTNSSGVVQVSGSIQWADVP